MHLGQGVNGGVDRGAALNLNYIYTIGTIKKNVNIFG